MKDTVYEEILNYYDKDNALENCDMDVYDHPTLYNRFYLPKYGTDKPMITMKDMGNDIIEAFILDDDKCYIGKDRYYVKGDKAELLTCSRLKSGKIRKMVSFYPDDLKIIYRFSDAYSDDILQKLWYLLLYVDDEYKSKNIRLLRHKLKKLHKTTRRALTRFAHDYCGTMEFKNRENHKIA